MRGARKSTWETGSLSQFDGLDMGNCEPNQGEDVDAEARGDMCSCGELSWRAMDNVPVGKAWRNPTWSCAEVHPVFCDVVIFAFAHARVSVSSLCVSSMQFSRVRRRFALELRAGSLKLERKTVTV